MPYSFQPMGVKPKAFAMNGISMTAVVSRRLPSIASHRTLLWVFRLAMLGSLLLTTAVIEIPFIANAFGFTPIGWNEYGIAMALAILVIPVVEIVKLIQRACSKK